MLFADRRSHVKEFWDSIPRLHRLAFCAFFIAAWAIGMVSVLHAGGNPEQHGSHYVLDDRGSLSPVTHAAYQHALILQTRICSLGPAVFFAYGVIVNSYRADEATPTTAPST